MSETKNAIIDDMNIRRECACFYQTAGHTFYFIFDDGTVRSTRNVLSDPKTWRVIASYNGKGYRRVRIEGKTYKVHRLVATTSSLIHVIIPTCCISMAIRKTTT